MTHTPIPWVWDTEIEYCQIYDLDDKGTVAVTAGVTEEDQANAAFIVRAANNHDKLLEALAWIKVNSRTIRHARAVAAEAIEAAQ